MARIRHIFRDRRGTATVEFVLVLPVALFLSLALLQLMLLMGGFIFVHYAAFAATRSAIVYVPTDFGADGEPANEYVESAQSPKHQAIHRAASAAMVPVSGRASSGVAGADTFAAALGNYYQAAGVATPKWVSTLAPDRFRYAFQHTTVAVSYAEADPVTGEIDFIEVGSNGSHTFGPKDPIAVRVQHRFHLSVPYVRWLFADGGMSSSSSPDAGYATLAASYTLTNEGIAANLPPTPGIDRDP